MTLMEEYPGKVLGNDWMGIEVGSQSVERKVIQRCGLRRLEEFDLGTYTS